MNRDDDAVRVFDDRRAARKEPHPKFLGSRDTDATAPKVLMRRIKVFEYSEREATV
jgi:hypothetical protein